ncbi:hypothetical protein [Brachyspira murdochii]
MKLNPSNKDFYNNMANSQNKLLCTEEPKKDYITIKEMKNTI